MKTVYVMFGEMGCGKTYCGSNYAQRHDFRFFDGDSVITPRMLEVEAPDGIFFLFLVIMIFSIGVATLRLMKLIQRL